MRLYLLHPLTLNASTKVGKSANMGLSENSVSLNPMVLLIIIPIKWLFHWEYTLFSDKPTSVGNIVPVSMVFSGRKG